MVRTAISHRLRGRTRSSCSMPCRTSFRSHLAQRRQGRTSSPIAARRLPSIFRRARWSEAETEMTEQEERGSAEVALPRLRTVEKAGGTSMSPVRELIDTILIGEREKADLDNRAFVVSAFGGITDKL